MMNLSSLKNRDSIDVAHYIKFQDVNQPETCAIYDKSGKDLPTSLKVPPSRSKFARCGNSEQGILYP